MAVNDTRGLIRGLIVLGRLLSNLWWHMLGFFHKKKSLSPRKTRTLPLDELSARIDRWEEQQKALAAKGTKADPPVVIKPSPTADEVRQVVEACYGVDVTSVEARGDDGILVICPFDLGEQFDTIAEEVAAQIQVVKGLRLTESDILVEGHVIKLKGLRLDGPDLKPE